MITAKIPYEFIRQRAKLNWNEIMFGLEHEFISPEAAINKASDRLNSGEDVSNKEIELAGLPKSESVTDLVTSLASAEAAPSDENIRALWLYLVLAWLYEKRNTIADPLGAVEEVYSDFGYPGEIAAFVRYMPMTGPDLSSRTKNEERLYDYWKTYLDERSRSFGR